MKYLIIGDVHLRSAWHNADLFEDRRIQERKEIHAAIHKAAEGCNAVIQLGDFLDARNVSPKVIEDAIVFLEGFGPDKPITILSGNHASSADGTAAEDFINQISGKNWRFVNDIHFINDLEGGVLALVPYRRRQQHNGAETDQDVMEDVVRRIFEEGGCADGKLGAIMIHHAIAGSKTSTDRLVDLFSEPIFNAEDLLKLANRVIGAHIHKPQEVIPNVNIVGSVQNQDIGEIDQKQVMVWDSATGNVEFFPLPGRKLAKLVNPTEAELKEAGDRYDYVRVVTDGHIDIPESMKYKVHVIENPKDDRKKVEEISDFSIPSMLGVYARSRAVPIDRLMAGWDIVKEL